jgi:hypothetical protein
MGAARPGSPSGSRPRAGGRVPACRRASTARRAPSERPCRGEPASVAPGPGAAADDDAVAARGAHLPSGPVRSGPCRPGPVGARALRPGPLRDAAACRQAGRSGLEVPGHRELREVARAARRPGQERASGRDQHERGPRKPHCERCRGRLGAARGRRAGAVGRRLGNAGDVPRPVDRRRRLSPRDGCPVSPGAVAAAGWETFEGEPVRQRLSRSAGG